MQLVCDDFKDKIFGFMVQIVIDVFEVVYIQVDEFVYSCIIEDFVIDCCFVIVLVQKFGEVIVFCGEFKFVGFFLQQGIGFYNFGNVFLDNNLM